MKSLMHALKVIKKMDAFDVSIYKIMLYTFAFLLARAVPELLEVHPVIYLVITVVLLGYVMIKVYAPRKKDKGFIKNTLANFHELNFSQVASFEIGMTVLGILLYMYIPWLQNISNEIYIALFFFGLAWIFSMWKHQK